MDDAVAGGSAMVDGDLGYLDTIATAAAQKEAASQAALTAKVRRQLAEVQQHVRSLGRRGCVTYGLVRCSTPQFTVSSPTVSPSSPENLMPPARELTPLLWLDPSSTITEPQSSTPSSSTP
jgi:hypothetical protein